MSARRAGYVCSAKILMLDAADLWSTALHILSGIANVRLNRTAASGLLVTSGRPLAAASKSLSER
jgi:hypothetical protein